jgi:CubicO group peptidase (beta-lactamase class C family)
VRRIDPQHRTIGQVLHEDIATPLGVGDEVYIGTPTSVPDERLAALIPPAAWARLTSMPLSLTIDALRPGRCCIDPWWPIPGPASTSTPSTSSCVMSRCRRGGAVATARALATAYGAFADAGGPLGLRRQTLDALAAPATPARRGYYDECFRGPTRFSLGFMKPSEFVDFGSQAAFGAPGAGGSMGFADPAVRLGYGYVTDRMGMELQGDPRDLALRRALVTALAHA